MVNEAISTMTTGRLHVDISGARSLEKLVVRPFFNGIIEVLAMFSFSRNHFKENCGSLNKKIDLIPHSDIWVCIVSAWEGKHYVLISYASIDVT